MEVTARNAPHAFEEMVQKIRTSAVAGVSRNGPVYVIPEPVVLTITNPRERFLFDPHRKANPIFHIMETVWMLAGSNDVSKLVPYNSRYTEYAEVGGEVHGAYGHRWINHFNTDQIMQVVALLKPYPTTRRAVIGMWDPATDLNKNRRDLPCNTHIYFRSDDGVSLDMTICNRSNDLVWGMLGANVVHMTYLQELIATLSGMKIGKYRVFTNNLHFYENLYPNGAAILGNSRGGHDLYGEHIQPYPLLQDDETWHMLYDDCRALMNTEWDTMYTQWANDVALPVKQFWKEYKKTKKDIPHVYIDAIKATDIREAVKIWITR